MSVESQVAVVTGAASGIGAATARKLAQQGALVIVADRNQADGERISAEINEERQDRCAFFQKTDVSDWVDVQQSMTNIAQRFGRINVLINNAGIGTFGKAADLSVEDWNKTIAVTLNGVFFCSKAVIPFLRQAGGGTIVNVGSISGLVGDFSLCAYNAAKGGVVNFSRALAIDYIRENIRVNCVCPGMVETPASAPIKNMPDVWTKILDAHPRGRASTPEEIAAVIVFLASKESVALVGSALVADGGLTAWTGMPPVSG
jgi:meso-butanediol dehydrogenase / (S,S)-butanediol dehydrogenase / diacetyl reductase